MRTVEFRESAFDPEVRAAVEVHEGHAGATLTDHLADLGLSISMIEKIEGMVEREAERRSFHHAAGVLRRIMTLVSARSTHGSAFAWCLGLHDEVSLRELAEQFSTSKQSIGNLTAQIKAALDPVLPDGKWRPTPRPPKDGRTWYSPAQAAKYAGVTIGIITYALRTGQLVAVHHDERQWIDEEAVVAWAATLPPRKAKDAATGTGEAPEATVATGA